MRAKPSPEDRYAALCTAMFARGEVSPSDMKGFGASALTVRGRIFAMLTRSRLVVKLPKARVDALVAAGLGVRFDANRGVAMKEWLSLDPDAEADWSVLADEALEFVKGARR
jgi:hypothetical protein